MTCPHVLSADDPDKWEDDALCIELNHGWCFLQGQHPDTSDADWALFAQTIAEPAYSEARYRRLEARLNERWEMACDDHTEFAIFRHEGHKYLRNGRGDLLTEEYNWVGRWDGAAIDRSFPMPDDLKH